MMKYASYTPDLTRKQANVVYSNFKRENIRMTKKQVSNMYDLVGRTYMEWEEHFEACDYAEVCSWLCKNRYDLAQAVLDGYKIYVKRTPIYTTYAEDDFAVRYFGKIAGTRKFSGCFEEEYLIVDKDEYSRLCHEEDDESE